MNYLAHLYLAGNNTEALLGNLMGDFVKGHVDRHFPPAIQEGIALHRKIDAFTDAHPLFRRSKQRLSPEVRRYGGILVDLFYDHFLARHWTSYATLPLRHFSQQVYGILLAHYELLPHAMQRSVSYMIRVDLLMSYQEITGIDRALQGIGRRLKRANPLASAAKELQRHYPALAADFAAFFPELRCYVAQKRPACTTDIRNHLANSLPKEDDYLR